MGSADLASAFRFHDSFQYVYCLGPIVQQLQNGNRELYIVIKHDVLGFSGWSMGCVACLGGVSFPMRIKLFEVEYKNIRMARNLEEFK